jgi:hypothetical protein
MPFAVVEKSLVHLGLWEPHGHSPPASIAEWPGSAISSGGVVRPGPARVAPRHQGGQSDAFGIALPNGWRLVDSAGPRCETKRTLIRLKSTEVADGKRGRRAGPARTRL